MTDDIRITYNLKPNVTYSKSNPYSNKSVTQKKYDQIIKEELELNSWIQLSNYSILDHSTKRKFIIKQEILDTVRYTLDFFTHDCSKQFENFENRYGVNLYENYHEVSDESILDALKYCCSHSFLPNIIRETDNFFEVEYLHLSQWKNLSAYERSTAKYLNAVNNYCEHIKDSKFCIALDPDDNNIMINRKTGIIKNIDIEDIFPVSLFIPGMAILESDTPCYSVIMTNYTWSADRFNKSFDYYKGVLKILLHLWDIGVYEVSFYENETDKLSKKLCL